jgi:hypothetical protein
MPGFFILSVNPPEDTYGFAKLKPKTEPIQNSEQVVKKKSPLTGLIHISAEELCNILLNNIPQDLFLKTRFKI